MCHGSHYGLMTGHLAREKEAYAIMRHAIRDAKHKGDKPLVVDVGSNHGLYSLYAAALGSDVIAVEPQAKLCSVIKEAVAGNSFTNVNVTVVNCAILHERGDVSMRSAEIAEGAVGTVVRGRPGGITAVPLTPDVVPGDARVAFLKVDVEGFESHALLSAGPLLEKQLVRDVIVEFGPPSRWASSSGDTPAHGVALQEQMHKWGYEVRLLPSFAYGPYLGRTAYASPSRSAAYTTAINRARTAASRSGDRYDRLTPSSRRTSRWSSIASRKLLSYHGHGEHGKKEHQSVVLAGPDEWKRIVDTMASCNCEAYLWFKRKDR